MIQQLKCYIVDIPKPIRGYLRPDNELTRFINNTRLETSRFARLISENICDNERMEYHNYQKYYKDWLDNISSSDEITLYCSSSSIKYGLFEDIQKPIHEYNKNIPNELIQIISKYIYSKSCCDIWFIHYKYVYNDKIFGSKHGKDLDIIPFNDCLDNGDLVVLNLSNYFEEKKYIYG